MIVGVDRLDYSKGITQRLHAFEMFLEKYPEYSQKVSILMVVVPSRDQVEKYKELKEEIDETVGRINSSYGRISWTPIHYYYRSFALESLSAEARQKLTEIKPDSIGQASRISGVSGAISTTTTRSAG